MKTSPESSQRNFDEFGSGADGILGNNNETRGTAWALRNLVDAAAYYPDGLVRNYFGEKVTNNLQWLDNYVNNQPATNPLKIPWIGFRPEPGMVAMWEMNYVAWAIDRANKQGFEGGLAHRDVIAKLQLDLFRNTPGVSTHDYADGRTGFRQQNGEIRPGRNPDPVGRAVHAAGGPVHRRPERSGFVVAAGKPRDLHHARANRRRDAGRSLQSPAIPRVLRT